jgi:FKBP-type peptidyl-prolyl cis-trans isomerase SlyD
MQIADRTFVTIHYTLTDSAGKVLDSSEGPDDAEPLSYLQGAGMIVPGLEAELLGKSEGDHVKVTIGPEGGYGLRQDDLVQKLSRDEFPEGEIEIGMHFRAHTPHGARVLTVVATDKETVTVDGNHPLAGTTLNFDVKVLSVREPTKEDMQGIGHGEHGDHGEHDCSSCHGCGGH